MKKLFVLLVTLSILNVALSQEVLKTASLNPDYLNYLESKKAGNVNNITSDGHGLGEIPSPVILNFTNVKKSVGEKFDASYDLRTVNGGNWLTSVKDQGSEGACWAFATMGSVESYWLKSGQSEYDLSEQNITTCHGFDWGPSDGGNYNLSTAYLSRRSGPISESDDPYTLPSNPDCVSGFTPVAYVGEVRFLPGIDDAGYSSDIIKQALLDYGAIYVNMNYDGDYFNNSDYTYYYDGSGTNHAVLLVGWDDNKVVTGGTSTPTGNGAWIIRNSWGPTWGESGFFYISYEDAKALSSVACFPSFIEYDNNSEIYFYDDLGWYSSFGYSDETDYGLVKYIASGDQEIKKIGTSVNTAGTVIDIEIFNDFNGTTLSGSLGSLTNQTCNYPGYHTFDLSTAINITNGNDFFVRIKYYTPGYDYPIPYEAAVADYSSDATIETGKCWVSSNGTSGWLALGGGTDYLRDLCIKVYATDVASTAPTADFSAGSTTIGIGESINFTDNSSSVPTSWSWVFEGGTPGTSTDQNPANIVYNTPGSYDVTLTATNEHGSDTETKYNYITVADITIITEDSFESGSISGWTVIDNDNNGNQWGVFSETANPDFDLAYTGDYGVGVNYNSNGNDDWLITPQLALPANSTVTLSFWARSHSSSYLEDFNVKLSTTGTTIGSFTNNIGQETSISSSWTEYTYDISSFSGESAYIAVQCVSVNDWYLFADDFLVTATGTSPTVTAGFSGTPTSGEAPLTVAFTDESEGDITSWSWEFGDGGTSTYQNPSHEYTSAGDYTVSLTVSDGTNSDTETKTNYINVTEPVTVTADFSATPTSGEAPLTVNFTDESEGDITSWSWEFGDGGTSTEQNPTHEYTSAGDYTVSLTVSDGTNSDTETKTDYINVTETVTVTADFSATPTSGEAPLAVNFTDESEGNITSWSWDFGDGGTSTDQNPGYEYTTAGEYTVSLTVSDGTNSDTETKTDYINVTEPVIVTADFSATPTSGTAPLMVEFTDLSENATSWSWEFGDGGTSTEQNPTHEYTSAGNYTVSLTVSDGTNSDTETKTNYITVTSLITTLDEGFESGFVSGWTIINNDGDENQWGLYSEITNPDIDLAYTGNYGVGVEYNELGNDDWLITPQISLSEGTKETLVFSFYARSRDAEYPEDFNVKLSTSGNAMSDFTVTLGEETEVADEWTQYIYDISAYAGETIYLTVQCVSVDDWFLFADDFFVGNAETSVTAEFSANPVSGEVPLMVSFSDESEGDITSWSWDFGDDGTSTDQNPNHEYTSAGDYTVSLTVSDGTNSDTETKVDYITVDPSFIEDAENKRFMTIYPNPSGGVFNFEFRNINEQVSISIYTLEGKTVFSEIYQVSGNNIQTIDLTKQPKGMYLINVVTEDKVHLAKIMIE